MKIQFSVNFVHIPSVFSILGTNVVSFECENYFFWMVFWKSYDPYKISIAIPPHFCRSPLTTSITQGEKIPWRKKKKPWQDLKKRSFLRWRRIIMFRIFWVPKADEYMHPLLSRSSLKKWATHDNTIHQKSVMIMIRHTTSLYDYIRLRSWCWKSSINSLFSKTYHLSNQGAEFEFNHLFYASLKKTTAFTRKQPFFHITTYYTAAGLFYTQVPICLIWNKDLDLAVKREMHF